MYFEPAKKTYYRFPSSQSIDHMSSNYYFPDKPAYSEESTRFSQSKEHANERTTNYK